MSDLPVPKFKVGQLVRNACPCGMCRSKGGLKKIWRVDNYHPQFKYYSLTRPGYVDHLDIEGTFLTDAMPATLSEDML